MTPLEAAWEAVLGAPDDDHALLVLADALMERGDPLGELIRLGLGKDFSGFTQHLRAHGAELMGDPAALERWSLSFSKGFITTARISTLTELEALLALPASRILRQLEVAALEPEPIDRLGAVLAARAPRTLRVLSFGVEDSPEASGELQVAPLLSRLPALEALSVSTWAANFEQAHGAALEFLRISLLSPVRGLGEARFPALERLWLRLPFRAMDLPLALLGGEVAPQLASLTLVGALWPQQLHELSGSALLRRLSRLTIQAETETGWYGALMETIDAFAHLEQIELRPDPQHLEWMRAVRAALPRVQFHDPRVRL